MNALDFGKIMHYNDLFDKFVKSLNILVNKDSEEKAAKFVVILDILGNSHSADAFQQNYGKIKKELNIQEKEVISNLFNVAVYYEEKIVSIDFDNCNSLNKEFIVPVYLRYLQRKKKVTYAKLAIDSQLSEDTVKHLFAPSSMQKSYLIIKKQNLLKIASQLKVENSKQFVEMNRRESNYYCTRSIRLTDDELDEKEKIEDLGYKYLNISKIENSFLELKLTECNMLTEYFDFYIKINSEYWTAISNFNRLNSHGKASIKNYIYLMQISNSNSLKTGSLKTDEFIAMCLAMKGKSIKNSEIANFEKSALWERLFQQLMDERVFPKVFTDFSEHLEAYPTMDEDDWNFLIEYARLQNIKGLTSEIQSTLQKMIEKKEFIT